MPFRIVVTLFLLLAVGTASHSPCTFPNYAFPPQPRCDLASEEPDEPEDEGAQSEDEKPDSREVAPDPTPTTRADDVSRAPSPSPQPEPTTTGGTTEPLRTPDSPVDTTVTTSPSVDTPPVTEADRPAVDAADNARDRESTGPSSTVVALVLVAVSAVGILLGKAFARGSRRQT